MEADFLVDFIKNKECNKKAVYEQIGAIPNRTSVCKETYNKLKEQDVAIKRCSNLVLLILAYSKDYTKENIDFFVEKVMNGKYEVTVGVAMKLIYFLVNYLKAFSLPFIKYLVKYNILPKLELDSDLYFIISEPLNTLDESVKVDIDGQYSIAVDSIDLFLYLAYIISGDLEGVVKLCDELKSKANFDIPVFILEYKHKDVFNKMQFSKVDYYYLNIADEDSKGDYLENLFNNNVMITDYNQLSNILSIRLLLSIKNKQALIDTIKFNIRNKGMQMPDPKITMLIKFMEV